MKLHTHNNNKSKNLIRISENIQTRIYVPSSLLLKRDSALQYIPTGLSKFTFMSTISILLLFNNFQSKAQVPLSTFRFPAEFEQQQAVWLGWEKKDTALQQITVKIIKKLQGKVPVKMVIASNDLEKSVIDFLFKNGVDLHQIEINVVPGDRFWIRDNGATFLLNSEKQLGVVDFQWSSYGYYDWLLEKRPEMADGIEALKNMQLMSDESKLDQKMAKVTGSELIGSKLVIEGGALETNGKGVLLQCEEVTLQRNPGWIKEEIEKEYRRVLNIKKVIWLKKGTADDERKFLPYRNYVFTGVGGHLDEFVRFANSNTILLAWIDEEDKDKNPLNHITYERMKENLKILEKATDQDGNPFRIVKVPLPSVVELPQDNKNNETYNDTVFANTIPEEVNSSNKVVVKVAAVSYLNFLITNGMVINASYVNHGTSKEHEERVKAIFKEIFPDREQVWIDVFPLNRNGGGIHCMTHQEPFHSKKGKSNIPLT